MLLNKGGREPSPAISYLVNNIRRSLNTTFNAHTLFQKREGGEGKKEGKEEEKGGKGRGRSQRREMGDKGGEGIGGRRGDNNESEQDACSSPHPATVAGT